MAFEDLDAAPAGIQDMATGDIDGDGLDDLIIKTIGALWVRRQPPCSALAVWDGRCVRDAR